MKVLVTGASGQLGNNVVRTLLNDGYEVVVFLRENSKRITTLDGLNIERRFGELSNQESLEIAMQDVDYVIHTAAKAGLIPARSQEYWDINYQGTKNVVEAAIKCGVKRLVHVGTANSFGTGFRQKLGDETFPYTHSKFGFDYMDSKRKAQEYVINATKEKGLSAIVVNPTTMIGKFDSKPNSGKFILAIFRHEIFAKTKGGKNYVNVRDASQATVNALRMGRVGECYILGGHNLSHKKAFDIIGKVEGVSVPKLVLPSSLVLIFGILSSFFGKIFGFTPLISKELAQIFTTYDFHSSEKAVRELNLQITPFDEAVKECLEWMLENEKKKLTGLEELI